MNTYKFRQILFMIVSLFFSYHAFADPGVEASKASSCDNAGAEKSTSNLKEKAVSVLQQLGTLSFFHSNGISPAIPPYMSKAILEGDLKDLFKETFGRDVSIKDFPLTMNWGQIDRWVFLDQEGYREVSTAFLFAIIDQCKEKSEIAFNAKIDEYLKICDQVFYHESEIVNCFELLLRMMASIIYSYDHRKETGVSTKEGLFVQVDLLLSKLDTEKKSENKVFDVEQNVKMLLKLLHSLYDDVEFNGGRAPVIQKAIEKELKIIFEETFGKDYSILDFQPSNQDGYNTRIDLGNSKEFMNLVHIFLPEVISNIGLYMDICDLYFVGESKEVDCLAHLLWTCAKIVESFRIMKKTNDFSSLSSLRPVKSDFEQAYLLLEGLKA